MYVFSVFKNLFKKNNIGTIIFFFLNAGLIFAAFSSSDSEVLIQIAILYVISICLALSPIGECFLSFISGARKMRRVDTKNRILPIVQRAQ